MVHGLICNRQCGIVFVLADDGSNIGVSQLARAYLLDMNLIERPQKKKKKKYHPTLF
jgi:hypothetical protein